MKRLTVHMIPQNLDKCLAINFSYSTDVNINLLRDQCAYQYDVMIPRLKDMVTGYGPRFNLF